MTLDPIVSVLMTAYNREKYIAEAVESVLASTFTNFELIIVDDCSVDNTVQIAKEFAVKDKRVKVFVNEKNLGDYPNRNKAASYANGKYLKYLDSDDIIYPWGLKAMVLCMEKFPEASLGLCTRLNGNELYPLLVQPKEIYRLYFYKSQLLHSGPSGAIINKKSFDSIGGFSNEQFIGDTELWLKMSMSNSLVVLPSDLIYWREHEGQQIKQEMKNARIELSRMKLNERILLEDKSPLSIREGQNILRNLKNIKCRQILITFCKGQFYQAFQRTKVLNLTLSDFLFCFRKNKISSF